MPVLILVTCVSPQVFSDIVTAQFKRQIPSCFISLLGKACGGIFTDSKHIFKTPGYPKEYENDQTCYWHIRVKYGQRIQIQFLDFDLEDDTACMADYLEIYDSYDDVNGFVGR